MIRLITLVMCFALGPVAIDVFLPALPTMTNVFNASPSQLQSLLSVYFIIQGVTQLFYGPIADRYGRMIILYISLTVFMAGSIVLVLSDTLTGLLIGRILQAIAVAGIPVAIMAMVIDSYNRQQAGIVMSNLTTALAVAPILAPSLGVVSMSFVGWQGPFYFMGLYGFLCLVFVKISLYETLKKPVPIRTAVLLANSKKIFKSKLFIAYCFQQVLLFGIVFVFLSLSSYMYVQEHNVSEKTFSIIFGGGASVFMLASFITGRLLKRYSPLTLFKLSYVLCFITVILCYVGYTQGMTLQWTMIVQYFSVFAVTFSMSHARSAAVGLFPETSGLATSIMGTISSSLVAVVGWVATVLYTSALTYSGIVATLSMMVILLGMCIVKMENARTKSLLNA